MVLKANDRRTSCPCHDEFRGPRSDYVRQVMLLPWLYHFPDVSLIKNDVGDWEKKLSQQLPPVFTSTELCQHMEAALGITPKNKCKVSLFNAERASRRISPRPEEVFVTLGAKVHEQMLRFWDYGSLVVKVTDSWLACLEFEPSTAENPPCRGGRCKSNLPWLKRPPVDVKGKLEEKRDTQRAQVSSSFLPHGSELRGPSPIALV
ncbi:hypothetical protein TNCV_2364911 [Trichonephila clavipes]|nr:hypothetical protein TNCV_2364911 [Trichonephila clavipes]